MKNYFIILFLLLSTSLFAQAEKTGAKPKDYQWALLEAQAYIKGQLTTDLKGATGLNEFTLQVVLEVNEKKLESVLGIGKADLSKLEGVQLPGLLMDNKGSHSAIELHLAKKEDILLSLSKLKVIVGYHQEKYSQQSLQTILAKIVAYNYPTLAEANKEILVSKEETTYSSAITKESVFLSFWDMHFKKLIIAGFVFLALVVFIGMALKGGLAGISEVIKSKTLGAGRSDTQESSPRSVHESFRPSAWQNSGPENFESYMQASEHLAETISKEAKVCNEIIVLKLMVEDFIGLTILLDVLPKEKKDLFLNNLDHKKRNSFKEYIVETGPSVLLDEAKLKDETIKLIKLIKITALAPEDLYGIVLVDLVASLLPHETKALLEQCSAKEKAFICDHIRSEQIALYVQNDVLGADDFEWESSDLSNEESVDLIIKTTNLKKITKGRAKKDKMEIIYSQIESTKAEILAQTIGIEPSMRLEYLFATYESEGLKYISEMDYNSLSAIFALLPEGMQGKVLGSLPELLAERLKFSKKIISAESLKLKGELYFYLKSLSENNRSNDSGNPGIAA